MMPAPKQAPAGFEVSFDRVTLRVPSGREMVEILREVSFRIAPGSFVCVLGTSGAGKSTIVRLLLGETPPTEGRILLDGQPPSHNDLASIGYVPQNNIVHESLTVGKALTYAARLRRPDETPDIEIAAAIVEVEKALGIESRHDIQIARLSGGRSNGSVLPRKCSPAPGCWWSTRRPAVSILRPISASCAIWPSWPGTRAPPSSA